MSTPVGLFEAVVRDALDPSYAEVARRRAAVSRLASGRGPMSGRRRTGLAGAALLVGAGALAGLGVSSQHKVLPRVGAARSALAGNAGERTRELKALESTLADRQHEVAALQQQELHATTAGQLLARRAAALSAAAGQLPVRGPGVSVTIADVTRPNVKGGRFGTSGSRPYSTMSVRTGRVADRDLQAVVNALWAGGAEAIDVGGIRLGPQTAIRTAGQTILADFRPLRSPYRIAAIGGPRLLDAVLRSPAVAALRAGPPGTHPDVSIRTEALLQLPAASAGQSRLGRPLVSAGHS